MAFQAAVATWFAAHILARVPVGGRFSINNLALPIGIRLETGVALDDIEVTQSDGGTLHCQCKTSATLATGEKAPLAKTGAQLAGWIADVKASTGGFPDPTKNAAVLAVRSDAAGTLNDLEAGCRAFDLGDGWEVTKAQRNAAELKALDALEHVVAAPWNAALGTNPNDSDLAHMARSFHIARFAMDEGDADWREASALLGRTLYGGDAAGDGPLRDLKAVMRDLIGNGAPADRNGLLRALRRRGHVDVAAPRYDQDVVRLRAIASRELARLSVHSRLAVSGGVTIKRESDEPLANAFGSGSFLLVGEPGAGKTGALVRAAGALINDGAFVVFLSVDRFPGVAIAADLTSELRLDHDLVEVLAAVPGTQPKYLIIDALDAARGGSSEGVFATLIDRVREELADDWTVVASIRSFDLRNGHRYHAAFPGASVDPEYSDPLLRAIRHFSVPRLTDADLAVAGAASVDIAVLMRAATAELTSLLRNVFNLSLAAELLADGTDASKFSGIATQAELIDRYEDLRLSTTGMAQAAAEVVTAMTASRRLAVRKVDVRHNDLDRVIESGVLTATGDLVRFSHHVLFDHIAGRHYLAWSDTDRLIAQLEGDTSAALLLAPALRFAVERVWRADGQGKPQSWKLVRRIFSATNVDPVLGNVALRILAENVCGVGDLTGLLDRISANPDDTAVISLLRRLSRFVAMEVEATRSVTAERALAWAGLAERLARTGRLPLIDPAQVLMQVLFEHADLNAPDLLNVFGLAARAMLSFAWSQSPSMPGLSGRAIRFVGRSYGSEVVASRILLDRVLREPHFSQHADYEAPWLTGQIMPIATADPAFAVEVYRCIYGQMIADTAASHLGGHPSRILPLVSNRRQEYEHSRWNLGKSLGRFLAISPEHGTRAVIDAVIGMARTEGYGDPDESNTIDLGVTTVEFCGRDVEYSAWDEKDEDKTEREDDPLANYLTFLRDCDVGAFSASVTAASRDYATASLWNRILYVASERVEEVGNLIWPLMTRPGLLENRSTLRDATRFVSAAWPLRSPSERERFERMALEGLRQLDDDLKRRWRSILGCIFASIPGELLALDATRELRRQMDEAGELELDSSVHSSAPHWGKLEDWMRDALRQDGVDMDAGPNKSILDASDRLHSKVKDTPSDSDTVKLAELWSAAVALLSMVEANTDLHGRVEHSAWGHISNAVERVASSPNYVPGTDGLPDLETMFTFLRRLSLSKYPEPGENGE